ncbi:hypothetical protein WICPIJ_010110 [Wickerhamomyces pijperi]|uniref:Uncharacterized protein n=1 Tax=Wickerhamomyces pijperi TaxID=599730 RepID=A0A9P8TBH6_WICPI|nr:hypothetical protein WICPIJ_010110 [Wickerhamomyces pijperi]
MAPPTDRKSSASKTKTHQGHTPRRCSDAAQWKTSPMSPVALPFPSNSSSSESESEGMDISSIIDCLLSFLLFNVSLLMEEDKVKASLLSSKLALRFKESMVSSSEWIKYSPTLDFLLSSDQSVSTVSFL